VSDGTYARCFIGPLLMTTSAAGTTFLLTGPQVGELDVMFDNVGLPLNTVYDYLGWIMSISWRKYGQRIGSNNRNYYLPLLSLYAKWCRLLGKKTRDKNSMVHIAWFTNRAGSADTPDTPDTPITPILLGSTIGSPGLGGLSSHPTEAATLAGASSSMKIEIKKEGEGDLTTNAKSIAKANLILRQRQDYLRCPTVDNGQSIQGVPPAEESTLLSAPGHPLDARNFNGGNYGACAETFMWIYVSAWVISLPFRI
jgi:hypothetical protein